ncbi:gas vesicle protein GvpO [Microbispora hainanensis]|uniref:Gas vesicle protein n=1 Tax=Microbispora hainanensis TaxID=568844 RepID=A0A544YAU9_9ACTN|nr:gas vesicle protein GvpO [Microbispora hainanensis]TQS13854.1 gas vesicle protein [Microbispora hainanensis]
MPPRRRARYDEGPASFRRRAPSGVPAKENGPYDEVEDEDEDGFQDEDGFEDRDERRGERRGERRNERAAEPRRRRAALNAVSAGRLGERYIADLTSKEIEGVISVEPVDDGWLVNIEVVEDRRIPSTGDMLSIYECQLDDEGNLMSYRRTRTYRRGTGAYGGGP